MEKRRSTSGFFRGHPEILGAVQRVTDSALIVGAHTFANWVYGSEWTQAATSATAVALVLYGFIAELNGLYRPWRSERLSSEARETALTWFIVAPLLFLLAFVT